MTIETAQPDTANIARRAEPQPAPKPMSRSRVKSRSQWLWLLAVVVAVSLPWLFFNWSTGRHSGFVLIMLSEIGLMTIFALSFNMQMGQAGLLSFGHAILFGLGGYCTAHALNAIKAGQLWVPTELCRSSAAWAGSASASCSASSPPSNAPPRSP
jgi:ABC-type branched-subunit amino acid transport system permease subunit